METPTYSSDRAINLFSIGLSFFLSATAFGQLAITEVMSSASETNLAGASITQWPDYWEVKNYGSNAISLANYEFADDKEVRRVLDTISPELILQPGELAIFYRSDPTLPVTEAEFRSWWASCLASNVQVRSYTAPGLSGDGDKLFLYDANRTVVDYITFGLAQNGHSFTFNTNTGDMDVSSSLADCGGCVATNGVDFGSPGTACGPVPLGILAQPSNVVTCAGFDAEFRVRAKGLPRAHFQWFRNGAPISGATLPTLVVTNAQRTDEGEYEVELRNGLEIVRSAKAILMVSTNPSPPTLSALPTDLEAYPGQAARFSVSACAFPLATYQWFSNNTLLTQATNRTLRISNVTLAMSGTEFCVRITNSLGSNGACARLTVIPKPSLLITEIMAAPSTGCAVNNDWFELTNTGTNKINLLGYRFFDEYRLETAGVITQAVVIRPSESIILAQKLTREMFFEWWGADNLPPDLQVITHQRFGLDQFLGDVIYFWNAAAEDVVDTVAQTSFAENLNPVSLYFNTNTCQLGCDSALALRGAFQSATCIDVASPGYVANPPPRLVAISCAGTNVALRCRAVERKSYQVYYTSVLATNNWAPLNTFTATNSVHTFIDTTAGAAQQRFYRVEELP